MQRVLGLCLLVCGCWHASGAACHAEPPDLAYLFPAGGMRGTTVPLRVGGYYLHDAADLFVTGTGVQAPDRIQRMPTLWFEGPVIPQPESQQKEDYPADYAADFQLDPRAVPGPRRVRVRTAQGMTRSLPFVVGTLPEIVEQEVDGAPLPTRVTLPVTINGRVFPRQDVDVWTLPVTAGQTVTCAVAAIQLGSPLQARIEVRDPMGKSVAEAIGNAQSDPVLRFAATQTGDYTLHIHDASFGGLQHYVYRLTVTAGAYVDGVLPLGGRPGETLTLKLRGANLGSETIQVTLPDTSEPIYWWQPTEMSGPALGIPLEVHAANSLHESADPLEITSRFAVVREGCLAQPGERDVYVLSTKKGQSLRCTVQASRLNSSLDARLVVFSSNGQRLLDVDDAGNSVDPQGTVTFPEDGLYRLEISDRVPQRGGPDFGYRLHLQTGDVIAAPDLQLTATTELLNVPRGGKQTLAIEVLRQQFDEAFELQVAGLPEGVTVTGTTVEKGQNKAQLTFTATEAAPVVWQPLRISTTVKLAEQTTSSVMQQPAQPGSASEASCLMAVTLPTPFKFVGLFESKFAPRGSVLLRKYRLERGTFQGPIEISLADKQARHLQGVTGPKIIVPPGQSEFEYPVSLPPELEVGRTSRTCVMAVGEMTLADGTKAKVAYTSQEQNDQAIVLTAPEELTLQSEIASVHAVPGTTVTLPFRIGRVAHLQQPATLELICPAQVQGISAQPVTIAANVSQASLSLVFANDQIGPLTKPLRVRLTTLDARQLPVMAEFLLEIVP